jgi:hypothetical protein
MQTSESQDQEKYSIREAQISCVISGSDDWRWVSYAFVDTDFDGDEFGDGVMPYEDLHWDPIAAGNLEANMPIWKPREYFLKVFEIRIIQVQKEWDLLVRKVELSIDRYVSCHTSSFVKALLMISMTNSEPLTPRAEM